MTKNYLVVADDFGMSKGVNTAILELAEKKVLNGISVLTTGKFYDNYVSDLKQQKANNIKIGLHLDLTYGLAKTISRNAAIADSQNIFRKSFFEIFFLCFFKKKLMLRVLFREINQQLKKITNDIGQIDYIDGHQHIHSIPLIFQITKKLAKKYRIPRLRIINEDFFTSYNFLSPPSLVSVIKFSVLKFCYLINKTKSELYFYSILYSCKFDFNSLENLLNLKQENIEVMVHPGYSDIDSVDVDNREYKQLVSEFRDIERQQIEKFLERKN